MNLSDFTYNHAGIRHEIRNHLTLLSSRLQLLTAKYPFLKEDDLCVQLQEDLKNVFIILNYDKTGIRPQLLPCNMLPVLEELYQSYLPICQQKGIKFHIQIPDTLPVIRADARLIRQALLNLLKNAEEACTSGQEICLRSKVSATHLTLIVSDTGSGMSPEHQAHIFEPFISYKEGGTGLGLAIVQATAYAHHGQLTFHSEPGKGTTFRIALPLSSI